MFLYGVPLILCQYMVVAYFVICPQQWSLIKVTLKFYQWLATNEDWLAFSSKHHLKTASLKEGEEEEEEEEEEEGETRWRKGKGRWEE